MIASRRPIIHLLGAKARGRTSSHLNIRPCPIAVNARLAPPEAVADLPIDRFDGLDTFEDLPRDGRCVRDMWF
ncbi:hypothetical protein Mesop_5621 [Mesorhizobium opportunistum WSM2075]|uniref:Uncharacterized protein n=1 Tax=Mesorhizobium opportunistum (strain LMG 24607 / HAMBI 3007 / WSM2075) TaxID=536019 RepID=F7YBZ0_MESOW|nr:hypothetical protein Mesop_5621 [Mesorhizobium opportunistum WSM2075]